MSPVIYGLFLTNGGSADAWAIVIGVCVAAPVLLGLALRWRDRRRG